MQKKSLKEILKPLASKDGLELAEMLYNEEEIEYDGIEITSKGKSLTNRVESLIESKVIDHDTYTETISLEYQTNDFFDYLMEANTETNIEDVKKKIEIIKRVFGNIKKRKDNFEQITKEIKVIQKALRSIPSIIEKNSRALSNDTLFAYKIEQNTEIKIELLKSCKEQLSQLSKAIDGVKIFLDNKQNVFAEILPSLKILDSIRGSIFNQKKIVISILEATIDYLSKTIEDGNFLKKLNILNELIKKNELYKQTNIVEKIEKSIITQKINVGSKIDFDLINMHEELEKQYNDANIQRQEITRKEYGPIDKKIAETKKEIEIVRVYDVYKKYMKSKKDIDLANYLYLVLEESKKVNRFIASIVMKWNKNLIIKNETIKIKEYEYPVIKRKF